MHHPIAQAINPEDEILQNKKDILQGFFVEFIQDYYLSHQRQQMLKIAGYAALTGAAATATYFGLGSLGIVATTIFGAAACNETYHTLISPRIMTKVSTYLTSNSGEKGKFNKEEILGIVEQLGAKETTNLLNKTIKDVDNLVSRGKRDGISIVPITVESRAVEAETIEIITEQPSATIIENPSASGLSQRSSQARSQNHQFNR